MLAKKICFTTAEEKEERPQQSLISYAKGEYARFCRYCSASTRYMRVGLLHPPHKSVLLVHTVDRTRTFFDRSDGGGDEHWHFSEHKRGHPYVATRTGRR